MSKGYVYILTNPAMPGLVKIGMTTRDVNQRADELFTSGVPQPFEVYCSVLSPDCASLEVQVHDNLQKFRRSTSREFFVVDPVNAERVLMGLHVEQLREFVGEYTECHQLVDDPLAIDSVDMARLMDETGRSMYEVSAAISVLTLDEISPALTRWDKRVEASRSKRSGKSILKEVSQS